MSSMYRENFVLQSVEGFATEVGNCLWNLREDTLTIVAILSQEIISAHLFPTLNKKLFDGKVQKLEAYRRHEAVPKPQHIALA